MSKTGRPGLEHVRGSLIALLTETYPALAYPLTAVHISTARDAISCCSQVGAGWQLPYARASSEATFSAARQIHLQSFTRRGCHHYDKTLDRMEWEIVDERNREKRV